MGCLEREKGRVVQAVDDISKGSASQLARVQKERVGTAMGKRCWRNNVAGK